jgi:hypothetical protein
MKFQEYFLNSVLRAKICAKFRKYPVRSTFRFACTLHQLELSLVSYQFPAQPPNGRITTAAIRIIFPL